MKGYWYFLVITFFFVGCFSFRHFSKDEFKGYFNTGFNIEYYFNKAESAVKKEFPSITEFDVVDTTRLSQSTKLYYRKVIKKHYKLKKRFRNTYEYRKSFLYAIRASYRLNLWDNVIKLNDSYKKEYNPSIEKDRNYRLMLYYKGLSYLNQGYERLALDIFKQINLDIKDKNYIYFFYITLAKVWEEKQANSKAIYYYKKALEFTPNEEFKAFIYYKLGELYYKIKDYKNFKTYYTKLFSIKNLLKILSEEQIVFYYKSFIIKLISIDEVRLAEGYITYLKNHPILSKYKKDILYLEQKLYLKEKKYKEYNTLVYDFLSIYSIKINSNKIYIDSTVDTIKIKENLKDSLLLDVLLTFSDVNYKIFYNYQLSLSIYKFIKRNFKIDEDIKNVINERIVLINKYMMMKRKKDNLLKIGEFLFTDLSNYDSAYYYFLTFYKQNKDTLNLLEKQRILFTLYYIENKYYHNKKKAMEYLKEISSLSRTTFYGKKADSLLGRDIVYTPLDSLNILSDSLQEFLILSNYNQAKLLAYDIIKKFKKEYPDSMYKIYFILGYIYEKQGIPDSAAFFYYKIKKDSFFVSDKIKGYVNRKIIVIEKNKILNK